MKNPRNTHDGLLVITSVVLLMVGIGLIAAIEILLGNKPPQNAQNQPALLIPTARPVALKDTATFTPVPPSATFIPASQPELLATWTLAPTLTEVTFLTITPWWGTRTPIPTFAETVNEVSGESATVVRVIDGDTIDVRLNGEQWRVRYVGINTPERDEPCYQEALNANSRLVQGQTVTLVADESDTDQYGRLLRYIYLGDTFVNEELVKMGYAEAVLYNPDNRHYESFRILENQAASQDLNCHSTGIFKDDSETR